MKNILLKLGLLTMLSFSFVACNSAEETEAPSQETTVETESISEESEALEVESEKQVEESATGDKESIRLGFSPNTIEIAEVLKEGMEKEGYDLEAVAFNDVIQPNVALLDNQLDGNFYQHHAYMDAYNKDNNTNLIYEYEVYFGAQSLYTMKYDDLSELPENAKIGIFDDASNQHRSLMFAQDIGLVKLAEKPSDELYSLLDIEDNYLSIEFVPLDRPTLVNALEDFDACFHYGSYVTKAGVDLDQNIAVEQEVDPMFAVGLVVDSENTGKEWTKAFEKVTEDPEIRKKIVEIYPTTVFVD